MPDDAPQPEPTLSPGAMPTTDPDALPGGGSSSSRVHARPGGGTIGAYTILGDKPLGSGGFGEVWLAERRSPFTQRVAIKIIKAGMDSREVIARFEQERQALAVMEHPNVAKVLDGGITPQGRPYFVMEYVRGEPITTFCDRHRLSLKQRLAMFIPVCEAVQHAHQKGIIHRDLKPGNILVSFIEQSGGARGERAKDAGAIDGMLVKVIDFGVAKATARTLTDKTIFTETGQMIGTPEYMSPEQAEMGGTDVDTRTDVYSLGVVLYELLVGLLPYDSRTLRSKGYDGIRKAIREGEAPRPSTRLSALGPDEADRLARARDLDAGALVSVLRKEAEWIPLMALRKERDRRYQSPSDLARDIQRYLEGAALIAGPESRWYKARKFARRYRAPLAVASVLALFLVGGFIAISLALADAREQRRSADSERLKAQAAERDAVEAKGKAQAAAEAEAAQRVIVEQQAYEANILAAGAFISQSQGGAAVEALEACPSALRGWEWGWLMRRADQATAVLRAGVNVSFARFSPDGSRVLTCAGGEVRLWSASGSGQSTQLGQETRTEGAGFSPDGRSILTFRESTFTVWDASDGQPKRRVEAQHVVNAAQFSPDGRFIVTAGADASARLWTSEGDFVRELKEHSEPLTFAAFSPDSTRVLTGSRDRTARVWRVSDGALLATMGESSSAIEQGAFSPDGTRVLLLSDRVRVWELRDESNPRDRRVVRDPRNTAALVSELFEPGQAPSSAAFSTDGKRVIVGGFDGSVVVYGATTGRAMRSLKGSSGEVRKIVPLRDNVHIVSGGAEGALRLWNADTGALVRTLLGHASNILDIDVTADGARAVTGSFDGTARLWSLGAPPEDRRRLALSLRPQYGVMARSRESALVRDGSMQYHMVSLATGANRPLPTLNGAGFVFALSPDAQSAAIALRTGGIALVDVGAMREVTVLDGHEGSVGALTFASDGTSLVSGGFTDKTIRVWDLQTHAAVASSVCTAPVYGLVIANDSKLLVVNDARPWRFVALPTWETLAASSASSSGPNLSMMLNHDDSILAESFEGVDLQLHRVPSGDLFSSIPIRPGYLRSMDFSPIAERLLTVSTDGALRITNVESPRSVLIDRIEPDEAIAAGFTPDGSEIVLLSSTAIYRWPSAPRTWELQQRLLREGRTTREQQEALVRDGVLKAWEIEPLPWVVDPAAPTAPSPSSSPRPSPPATAPPRSPPP